MSKDVRKSATEGEERGQRKQIAVDHPLDSGIAEAQLGLDGGDRDGDDRLVDEHHRHGEHHCCEGDPLS